MSYRKIEVNGKTYEYTIGKTHTKIKGFRKIFENVEIGDKVVPLCKCCGEHDHSAIEHIRVTPKIVSEIIEAEIKNGN